VRSSLAKTPRRQIRRALGHAATELVTAQHEGLVKHAQAIDAIAKVIGRGFLGRMTWLLFGR
jgi:hypothetical protein